MPASSPFWSNFSALQNPSHSIVVFVAWRASLQMVRVYCLPSYSRLRGAYSVLDASLEELVRSELKPVQTLVQLIDSRNFLVVYQASKVLQGLTRHGESLLPTPNDIMLISAVEKCQSEIIKADGLRRLNYLLGSTDHDLANSALSSVCDLSVWPANCPLIVEVLPRLVPILGHDWDARHSGTFADRTNYNRYKILACIRNLSCSGMGSPVSRIL